MEKNRKSGRYSRIYNQLSELLKKSDNPSARMATIIALLHHKIDYFFWTGFYFLKNDKLTVQMYQGPLACQVLEKNKGACWASINKNTPIIIDDVTLFPGHIACDSRSKSEIVIPIIKDKKTIGVLDIDSKDKNSFDEIDANWLKKIAELIYKK